MNTKKLFKMKNWAMSIVFIFSTSLSFSQSFGWKKVLPLDSGYICGVATNGISVLTANFNANYGIVNKYLSNDFGENWQKVNFNLQNADEEFYGYISHQISHSSVIQTFQKGTSTYRYYLSTDGGLNYSLITSPPTTNHARFQNQVFAADYMYFFYQNDNLTGEHYYSYDLGKTWEIAGRHGWFFHNQSHFIDLSYDYKDSMYISTSGKSNSWRKKAIQGLDSNIHVIGTYFSNQVLTSRYLVYGMEKSRGALIGTQVLDIDTNGRVHKVNIDKLNVSINEFSLANNIFTLDNEIVIVLNNKIYSTANYGASWEELTLDGLPNNLTNFNIYKVNGKYTLAGNGIVYVLDVLTSVNEEHINNLAKIWYNNTEKLLVVRAIKNSTTNLELYDVNGTLVYKSIVPPHDEEFKTSLKLTSGIYISNLISSEGDIKQKIVVSND